MTENILFRVCRSHRIDEIREGIEIETTTAVLEFCSLCGRYTNEIRYLVDAEYELVYEKHCDCADWIRHNDGGNYHYSSWRVKNVIDIRRVDGGEVELAMGDEALLN